ncbi:hypothetical protein [Agromyces agglutinans]|uniref:hypothetical protein n=1 Tax=Agromyces agglutinans TaxID=2662258 RepID=UPI001C12AEB1|nr:hypothetical protein [Agromyces agglutinans]
MTLIDTVTRATSRYGIKVRVLDLQEAWQIVEGRSRSVRIARLRSLLDGLGCQVL